MLNLWTGELKGLLTTFCRESKLENDGKHELFVYYNEYYLNKYPQLYQLMYPDIHSAILKMEKALGLIRFEDTVQKLMIKKEKTKKQAQKLLLHVL